jgi:hypothetical protein
MRRLNMSAFLLVVIAFFFLCANFPPRAAAQSWIQFAPSGSLPNGRVGASAVFSPASNRLIVFAGYPSHTASPAPMLNDLWILSNANGIMAGGYTTGAPGSPDPRNAQGAFYDQGSNRMIMFGGQNGFLEYNVVFLPDSEF